MRGPSFTVSSSCSSSGTALYLAFNMMKSGEADSVLVGASHLCLSPAFTHLLQSKGALSKEGRCKFMDESADGYVRSESCCVILMERLSCAKRVYAVVLNIETNNDGRQKRSFLSPSKNAHVELLERNLRKCNLSTNDIEYFEAHGTGTPVGDDIEIRALAEVYSKNRDRPLLVGSVKTNIGHTEATSGLCSIAKIITIFQSGWIPASLHYNKPKMEFKDLIPKVIEPVTRNTKYNGGIVGVNLIGAGGTNYHILLSI